MLIYFEEVLSGAGTFKLLSNYIKHYSKVDKHIDNVDNNEYNKHGFDYIFTLIDRTALNIEYEVLKKLHSLKNLNPEKHFIKFFELNAPVFTSPHMGNPIENEEEIINNIKNASNLDAIKKYIIENELIPKKINLPEDLYKTFPEEDKKYIHLGLTKSQFNLIKLYCTDVIYNKLSELARSSKSKFILDDIFNIIKNDNQVAKFTTNERLLKDIILKILTKHPFVHYKNICEKVLEYCINELTGTLKILSEKVDDEGLLYESFWSLRFYVKRLVELNSKFIISETFFDFLYNFYSKNRVYIDLVEMSEKQGPHCYLNDDYQRNQIKTFSAFLIYCYKRLIYNDYGTSIKLEQLLDSHSYQKMTGKTDFDFKETTYAIKDNYFKFLDMLTLENIFPFQKIYAGIKAGNERIGMNKCYKSFDLHNYDFFNGNREGFDFLNWDKPRNGIAISQMDLHEILDTSFKNIYNVLPKKPSYSLIYKYNESETSGRKDNYYYISTKNRNADDIGSIIELNKNGFISQLINGIVHKSKTQSYYTILKENTTFYTFTNHFGNDTQENNPINDALNIDLENTEAIGKEDNLYLVIRLSEIKKHENNKEYIVGNGAIIISFNLEKIADFFEVIDSRRMRNLLHIRRFFLEEIKSKFETKSFLKVLKEIETEKVRSKFNHGIDVLYKNSLLLLEKSEDINEIKSLKYPFHQIYNQTRMLLTTTNLKEEMIVEKKCLLNNDRIKAIFSIYMKLYNVYDKNIITSIKLDCNVPEFKTPLIFRDIIIPELFYNMSKVVYKHGVPVKDLQFSVRLKDNFLIITNPCNCKEAINFKKSNGGIEVINEILKKIEYEKIDFKQVDNTVTTTIQIAK